MASLSFQELQAKYGGGTQNPPAPAPTPIGGAAKPVSAPTPGSMTFAQLQAKYGKGGSGTGTGMTPPATTPAWAPNGLPKPAAPVDTKQPFQQPKVANNPGEADTLMKNIGGFVAGSEEGLGKEAAAGIEGNAATQNFKNISDEENQNLQTAITARNQLKSQGKDTSKADTMIAEMLSSVGQGASISDVAPAVNDTAGDVALNAAGTAIDTLFPAGEKKATEAVASIGQRSEKKAVAKITEDVAPKLNARGTANAISKQGTKNVGLLRRTVLNASKTTQDIAATVRKMVPDFKPGGQLVDNIEKTKTAAYDSVKQLASQVEKDGKNIAIPFKEITSRIDKAIADPAIEIAVKGTQFEHQIGPLKDAAIKIMKDNGGTPSGILRSTQDFDNLVRKVYPNLYDKEFTPARSAVKVIRDAMSNVVDDSLPDTAYKATRKAQSQLFTAIDNMSEKAASGAEKEIGTNAIQRFGENHPVLSKTAKWLGSGIALSAGIEGGESALKRLGL